MAVGTMSTRFSLAHLGGGVPLVALAGLHYAAAAYLAVSALTGRGR